MESYKIADSGQRKRQRRRGKLKNHIRNIKKLKASLRKRRNWAVTEKALRDSQNNIGMRGPFSSFREMMADINAEP